MYMYKRLGMKAYNPMAMPDLLVSITNAIQNTENF